MTGRIDLATLLIAVAAVVPPSGMAAQSVGGPGSLPGPGAARSCGATFDPGRNSILLGTVAESVHNVPLPEAKVTMTWRRSGDQIDSMAVHTDDRGVDIFCNGPAGDGRPEFRTDRPGEFHSGRQ